MKLFLKNLVFTILIPGTVAVYLPLIIARGRSLTHHLVLLILGLLMIIAGIIIYAWTVWDFISLGKGTPLPLDAPKTLVVKGLYRYTRNPMYIGVLLIILGWACVFANEWLLLYATGVWLAVHIFVVAYEEPKLKALFGDEYVNYQVDVARWMPHIH